ncbi:MAG: SpoIVB peptidase S55 domain-containing protein [Negativicutes bacterium]|nr:SpoIVB peptidase S55 domain-containing protein [Negativicutes bacterium]MDR3592639.1 SpoIVB peptidase S55 domain-containing protein [Negativicutes bacterium]
MSLVVRFCRAAIIAALLFLPAALVDAAPDILPVNEIKAGMHGIGKTVVTGTKIEDFDVEVLGIMKNKGPSGDLILVRTSGDVIDRTGGIAQGMSGSPVYIDGKLVGAVAYGWSFSDHKIGMVTPIADMLKLWEISDGKTSSAETTVSGDQLVEQATPLMAAGFSGGALEMLKTKLQPLNLVPYAVGDAPTDVQFGPLEPGSAIGAQLIRGDVSLGALGTVTYVEGNKVLAFGHPFLKKGSSSYFLTNGYVFTTVNGMENSFKVGTTGAALGVINQDRGAGIAGEIDRFPNTIPLRITVKDNTLGQSRDAEAQVVQDEQLSPILAAATVFSVIEKTMDRVGPGTAKVSFELSARNMPGEVFKRENLFYSPTNIDELAVSEIHELLALLASNQFQPVDVLDVKVNVTVDSERRTATVMEARPSVLTAKPGDKVDITVSLKPFRGPAITRIVPFTIPKNQAPGPLTLEVRGGGTVPLIALLKRQVSEGEVLKLADKMKSQTFADMLKELAERDHNNDIIVEILDTDLGEGFGDLGQAQLPAAKLEPGPKPNVDGSKKSPRGGKMAGDNAKKTDDDKSIVSTDYMIDSDTQIMITVTKPDGKAAEKMTAEKPNRVEGNLPGWH